MAPPEYIEEGWQCSNCTQLYFGKITPHCSTCGKPTKGPWVLPPVWTLLHICTDHTACIKTHINVSGTPVHPTKDQLGER